MNNKLDLHLYKEIYNKGYMSEQEVQSYPNKNKTMSFVFRGKVVFEYIPNEGVKLCTLKNVDVPAFDYCCFIKEDYKLMSEFFDTVYRDMNGEDVELKDIVVN